MVQTTGKTRAVEELDSTAAVRKIAAALPPVERAYALVRFTILRTKLLAMMNLVLPARGRILDVGCGFGLFSNYFALMAPERAITGVDPNGRRIVMAREVARALGVQHNTYEEGTIESVDLTPGFDGIFMLDVLHHVPPQFQDSLLERLRDLLRPGGVLLIKDITTDSLWKLKFTEYLDRAMVGMHEPLTYKHHHTWADKLESLGFSVRIVRVPDVLPYPHVVLVATKDPA